jgi:hypothetical protein
MNEIKITMPELRDPAPIVLTGQKYIVTRALASPVERRGCSEIMHRVKSDRVAVLNMHNGTVKRAYELHRELTARRNMAVALHDQVIAACDKLCKDWDREQARIAEESAAEQERANKAEERRLAAIAARCKDPEKREAYEQAAQQAALAPIAAAPPDDRAPGEVRSVRWRAELVSMPELIKAAAAGCPTATMLLAFDQSAATKAAGMFRRDGVVPGVRFYEDATISHRGS